jgi:hypothetical protein
MLKLSPVEALGAGRVDPFSSLPMDKPSRSSLELIDHGACNLLFKRTSYSGSSQAENSHTSSRHLLPPGLMPDDAAPSEVDRLSQAWFTSGLQTPLLFHALIYVGSNHLDFMRWSNVFSNAPEPLSHKLIVIQKLSQALSDPRQASRDEIILVILILASEVFISKKGNSSPFNSPLRSLRWLNMYGNLQTSSTAREGTRGHHHNERRTRNPRTLWLGGDHCRVSGILDPHCIVLVLTVVRGDIISSTNSLAKPRFLPLRIHTASILSLKAWAISLPSSGYSNASFRFSELERVRNHRITCLKS